MASTPAHEGTSTTGRWSTAAAQAAGLWAFVVALPVLDTLGGAPEFFVAHRADGWDVVALAAVVVAAVPAGMAVVLAAARRSGPRALSGVTGIIVGLLAALEAAVLGYRAGVASTVATIAVATTAFALAAAGWSRTRWFGAALTALSISVVAVPLMFLGASEIRGLLRFRSAQSGAQQASRMAPVVVVVFDELPLVSLMGADGRLDATRYPHLAALAADGIWFRNATTVSDYTRWALPAILTGRYPRAGSVPTPADHPDSLFTRLAATHRMEVTEPLTAICPAELAHAARRARPERLRRMLADVRVVAASIFLPPDARAGLPDFTSGWADFGAGDDGDFRELWRAGERLDPLAVADDFIEGIGSADAQPTLYFLHSLASHHPPRRLPSGQAIANFRTPPGMLRSMRWVDEAWPVSLFEQGALVQAGAVDTVVGRLRSRLEALGLFDRALVVVTADHGISFTPGAPIRGFSDAGAGGIVPVPLIVKLPAERQILPRGTVDDRNVETIDVLPTIVDALGLPQAAGLDGASALRDRPERPAKRLHFDRARQVRSFEGDAIARLRDAQVARKVGIFGDGAWPLPALDGLERLTGRPLTAFAIAPRPGPRLQIDDADALEAVDLAAPLLPVQVKGRVLDATRPGSRPVSVVVALNGVVASVTRTWDATGRWLALVPPASLRSGPNELRVFTIDPAAPAVLVPDTARAASLSLNLIAEEAAEQGVARRGFHHEERDGATRFHWTGAEATLAVGIDRATAPAALEIEILSAGQAGKPLRVLVDDCELASERLPGGRWSRRLPLGSCVPRGDWTTIRLLTETHRPGGRDRRRLGVAVSRIALVP